MYNSTFFLYFENKTYIENFNKLLVLRDKKSCNKLDTYNLIDLFNDVINIKDQSKNIVNVFFKINNKLVSPNTNFNTILLIKDNKTLIIECFRKQIGGGLLDDILDVIFGFLDPIIKPIVMIGNIFMFLIKMIVWLVKFIVWLVQFMIWIFTDLLNPASFVADFFNSLMVIIYTIINTIMNLFISIITLAINTIGGWMQGFWGWDMSSLTKNDKNSAYFKSFDRTLGRKTYITNTNNVPFSIILGTILCPPMGVFMDMGITGWLNILICGLLTLLFYLPGLCYALLIIYG